LYLCETLLCVSVEALLVEPPERKKMMKTNISTITVQHYLFIQSFLLVEMNNSNS